MSLAHQGSARAFPQQAGQQRSKGEQRETVRLRDGERLVRDKKGFVQSSRKNAAGSVRRDPRESCPEAAVGAVCSIEVPGRIECKPRRVIQPGSKRGDGASRGDLSDSPGGPVRNESV